jgi:DNA invertase Pin-like site-specific DNA recombinase
MRAAIYLRVSTDGQTPANQERELRAAAERIGHDIVAVYRDAGHLRLERQGSAAPTSTARTWRMSRP